ncbi:MAG: hypothetical protein IJN02_07260 [Bacteroidales bacterium]|nr:hypothetical protein [Bacteroidales bacterium]
MKKYIKGVLSLLILVICACLCFTSCDPDEVDAFAEGYRKGYYGTW